MELNNSALNHPVEGSIPSLSAKFSMSNTHNSNELLSHLIDLQSANYDSIPLGYLLGSKNKITIPIEPIITVLQSLGSIDINFQLDENKKIIITNDDGIQINFELKF